MANVADEIVEAGAEIIWVLEQNQNNAPGTAELCEITMGYFNATQGWCVGDSQTEPLQYAFDTSPFSVYRGFDMIVPRSDMTIVFESSHGSPSGNENLSGEELLEAVKAAVAAARR